MTELHTMYRVMILYMLNRLEYPLTNTQITNFILEKDYTNYYKNNYYNNCNNNVYVFPSK